MKTSVKTSTVNACGIKSSKKVTEKEIEAANDRINPDESSMESRG